MTVTLVNLHMTEAQQVRLSALGGALTGEAEVTVLRHDDVHACNTFEAPLTVVPSYSKIQLTGDDVIEIPAAAVMSIVANRK